MISADFRAGITFFRGSYPRPTPSRASNSTRLRSVFAVDHAPAREIDDPHRDDLAPVRVAGRNVQRDARLFEGVGHRPDRLRLECGLTVEIIADRHGAPEMSVWRYARSAAVQERLYELTPAGQLVRSLRCDRDHAECARGASGGRDLPRSTAPRSGEPASQPHPARFHCSCGSMHRDRMAKAK